MPQNDGRQRREPDGTVEVGDVGARRRLRRGLIRPKHDIKPGHYGAGCEDETMKRHGRIGRVHPDRHAYGC